MAIRIFKLNARKKGEIQRYKGQPGYTKTGYKCTILLFTIRIKLNYFDNFESYDKSFHLKNDLSEALVYCYFNYK